MVVESKNREIRMIKESNERANTMQELLAPLNAEKREIMKNLLESVQTPRLKNAYEKYLPAVLNNGAVPKAEKQMVVESRKEVTGDKSAKAAPEAEDADNVFEIRRLAGLN